MLDRMLSSVLLYLVMTMSRALGLLRPPMPGTITHNVPAVPAKSIADGWARGPATESANGGQTPNEPHPIHVELARPAMSLPRSTSEVSINVEHSLQDPDRAITSISTEIRNDNLLPAMSPT